MISKYLQKLQAGKNLNYDETSEIMQQILSGKENDHDIANFLKHLSTKGESNDEISAMLDKMQQFALHINPKTQGTIIDVCGTGGDKLQTFNISTTATFVIAAGGGIVAKHGNRSISGMVGSADIFEYFGYDLMSSPERVTEIIEKFGVGFMFAQKFHPAMKNVANARKMIGGRTAFNILGPLCNPANVKNQLIGVFSDDFLERLPAILKQKGAQNIITVRSEDGIDEFSTSAKNKVCIMKNDKIEKKIINPQDFGLQKSKLSDIQISSQKDAFSSFVSVLNNTANRSMIEVTALNSAAGFIVANICDDFQDGVELALNTIKSGKASDLLKRFVSFCGNPERLEEFEKN